MAQSFSVDDIQKMRTKLKTSKSYPNDFLRQQNQRNRINENNEEGDNSSSGVSSDQEIQTNNNGMPETKKDQVVKEVKPILKTEPKPVKTAPITTVVQQQNLKPSLAKTTQPTSILKQPSNITPNNISSNILNNNKNASNNIMNEPKKVAAQFNATPVTTRITTSIVAKMIPQVSFVVHFYGTLLIYPFIAFFSNKLLKTINLKHLHSNSNSNNNVINKRFVKFKLISLLILSPKNSNSPNN